MKKYYHATIEWSVTEFGQDLELTDVEDIAIEAISIEDASSKLDEYISERLKENRRLVHEVVSINKISETLI